MTEGSAARLAGAVLARFIAGLIVVALLLFVPAGSIHYWEGWLYLGVLFIPIAFVGLYLLKHDPELLERRMKTREQESEQRTIIALSSIIIIVGFVIPGLDHRFGWSDLPVAVVLAADGVVLLGYFIFFLTIRENSYAARVVEVDAGQKVIETGPYAVVRHPMYLGTILMFLATPLALGSFWAFFVFLPVPALIVLRIRNEEEVLVRELPGYSEYRQKTRYRLVPGVW
ncbi:methyltransferase family protein [Methanoculleus oceani]|uniref:Isoprenylcysteine carboxyl methyltransferase n=1 Tax=Methanoculleus oceani TaxID=2184756 RepID=A0ABD4TEC1_9EURY|nr:isoprenylcysteine carboxylmethyltransferase family protein [Methanoculleus sp. CWC-02]MCM2466223.1 isoprenylcysteine carboxyl methyltransferase [Methanoculleus sp. CWC-02]